MSEKLKIKPLTKFQILISIDRLTRFKPAEEKYLRVYTDLITSNLIEPKLKKADIKNTNYKYLTEIINKIFEISLKEQSLQHKTDYHINKLLKDYERSLFHYEKDIELLIDNKINYNAILPLLKESKELPYNLKWLKENIEHKNGSDFPVKKIILAEGITEEILLPIFAKKSGFDFAKEGVMVISAGGKNQVVKLFYKYADILKLPIYILLDCDAKNNLEEIKPRLRKNDKIHLLKGEFEDLLSLNLIKRTINKCYKNYFSIKKEDLKYNLPMVKILTDLYRSHGLEFKKAEFAGHISKNIKKEDITPELLDIITALKSDNK